MTPRGTDWGLALLVALLVATGALTLFAGSSSQAWVFGAHGAAGFALGGLLGWKLRRVWRRLARPRSWDRRTLAGAAAIALVAAALGSGFVWSSGGDLAVGGYTLLAWHAVLGAGLGAAVAAHALLRAKRLRRRDLADRRQFLQAAGMAAGAFVAWRVQRPVEALLGSPAARRRFTGSYEAGSFGGNAFPSTSWVADHPRPLDAGAYRLTVGALVVPPVSLSLDELDAGDELVATLDCTGGFYSTQRWRGISVARLLSRADGAAGVRHVSVVSHTGYRWSFARADAQRFLLATHVGGEVLAHEHGAPLRLVAPGRRGFQWVKWVVGLELTEAPDWTAPASTVWSSFSAAGRGSA